MTQPEDATIDYRHRTSAHEAKSVPHSDSAADVASILDGYFAELQAGNAPDRDALLAAHPELAAQLEACLAGIEFVDRAAGPAAEEPAVLGEFRIVREIGRGGMGVVYEAEQTPLRRRVALKVLRFGVVADEEAMKRFRREAETVARLHHTNIVPIFAVGCERGVNYYAMQLIEGRSLAEILEESQRTGRPLKAVDLARWGLQAAEALAHEPRQLRERPRLLVRAAARRALGPGRLRALGAASHGAHPLPIHVQPRPSLLRPLRERAASR
jgi:Protein kinase domain